LRLGWRAFGLCQIAIAEGKSSRHALRFQAARTLLLRALSGCSRVRGRTRRWWVAAGLSRAGRAERVAGASGRETPTIPDARPDSRGKVGRLFVLQQPVRTAPQAAKVSSLRILYFATSGFRSNAPNGYRRRKLSRSGQKGATRSSWSPPDTRIPPRDPWRFYGLPRRRAAHTPRGAAAGLSTSAGSSTGTGGGTGSLGRGRPGDDARPRCGRHPLAVPRAMRRRWLRVARACSRSERGSARTAVERPGSSKASRGAVRRKRRVWQRADGYVTITGRSPMTLRRLRRQAPPWAVVPDGVRPRQATGGSEPPAKTSRPVGVLRRNLYPWKGVDVLLPGNLAAPRNQLPGRRRDAGRRRPRCPKALRSRSGSRGAFRFQRPGGLQPKCRPILERADFRAAQHASHDLRRYTSPLQTVRILAQAGRLATIFQP